MSSAEPSIYLQATRKISINFGLQKNLFQEIMICKKKNYTHTE